MAKEKSTSDKVVESIINDLQSGDEKIIIDALKRTKSKGNKKVIAPMIELHDHSSSDDVKFEIRTLLSQIKVKGALLEIIEGLAGVNDDTAEMLLFSLWNANLNACDYLAEVIEASCKGNYMVALEGLTVVENVEGPFKEEVLNDAKLVLNEYFQQEDEKADLIKSILGCIREYDNFIEA